MSGTTERSLRPAVAWIAIISVGLAAVQMSLALFGGFLRYAVVTAPSFALVSMAVAWISLRWRGESIAARVCMLGSVLGGVVALFTSTLLVQWLGGGNAVLERALPGVPGAALTSAILGAPPGLVFGALFVLPIRRVHRLSRERALEAADRTLRVCGAWLLSVSVVCVVMLATVWTSRESPEWFSRVELVSSLLIGLIAAVAATVSHIRISRRRRWFERVREGREAGWTIVPRSFVADELDDLQTLFVSSGRENVVLVRTEALAGGGAYRTASNLVPFALVHLPEGLAAMSFSLGGEEQQMGAAATQQ